MSEKKPSKSKDGSSILDVLTRHIGKISALLVAIVGVLTTWQQLWRFIPTPSKQTVCFRPQLVLPAEGIVIGEWHKKRFVLTGKNECKDDLQVRVEFRAASDRIRIEPPYDNEWLVTSIDSGDVRLPIVPPVLTPLKLPLGGSVMIGINWRVYNADTQKLVRAGEAQLQLLDDPVKPVNATGVEGR